MIPREARDWSSVQSFHEHRILTKRLGGLWLSGPCYVVCYVSEHTANIMISDRLYRLLLSSGITFGGLGVAWILMKAIVPSKEEMLKVFTCEVFFSVI